MSRGYETKEIIQHYGLRKRETLSNRRIKNLRKKINKFRENLTKIIYQLEEFRYIQLKHQLKHTIHVVNVKKIYESQSWSKFIQKSYEGTYQIKFDVTFVSKNINLYNKSNLLVSNAKSSAGYIETRLKSIDIKKKCLLLKMNFLEAKQSKVTPQTMYELNNGYKIEHLVIIKKATVIRNRRIISEREKDYDAADSFLRTANSHNNYYRHFLDQYYKIMDEVNKSDTNLIRKFFLPTK
jgi:hypothetical protein